MRKQDKTNEAIAKCFNCKSQSLDSSFYVRKTFVLEIPSKILWASQITGSFKEGNILRNKIWTIWTFSIELTFQEETKQYDCFFFVLFCFFPF